MSARLTSNYRDGHFYQVEISEGDANILSVIRLRFGVRSQVDQHGREVVVIVHSVIRDLFSRQATERKDQDFTLERLSERCWAVGSRAPLKYRGRRNATVTPQVPCRFSSNHKLLVPSRLEIEIETEQQQTPSLSLHHRSRCPPATGSRCRPSAALRRVVAVMSMSPSSSPRLPSPPPMAEDQLGPKSPIVPLVQDQDALMQTNDADSSISMRIRPGTKSADMLDPAPVDPSDVSTPVKRLAEPLLMLPE